MVLFINTNDGRVTYLLVWRDLWMFSWSPGPAGLRCSPARPRETPGTGSGRWRTGPPSCTVMAVNTGTIENKRAIYNNYRPTFHIPSPHPSCDTPNLLLIIGGHLLRNLWSAISDWAWYRNFRYRTEESRVRHLIGYRNKLLSEILYLTSKYL